MIYQGRMLICYHDKKLARILDSGFELLLKVCNSSCPSVTGALIAPLPSLPSLPSIATSAPVPSTPASTTPLNPIPSGRLDTVEAFPISHIPSSYHLHTIIIPSSSHHLHVIVTVLEVHPIHHQSITIHHPPSLKNRQKNIQRIIKE